MSVKPRGAAADAIVERLRHGDMVARLRACRCELGLGLIPDVLDDAIDEIDRLRSLLAAANDAFDECTGDYPKELVAGEEWRNFRTVAQ